MLVESAQPASRAEHDEVPELDAPIPEKKLKHSIVARMTSSHELFRREPIAARKPR
jgi:hypothetical protein